MVCRSSKVPNAVEILDECCRKFPSHDAAAYECQHLTQRGLLVCMSLSTASSHSTGVEAPASSMIQNFLLPEGFAVSQLDTGSRPLRGNLLMCIVLLPYVEFSQRAPHDIQTFWLHTTFPSDFNI